MKKFNFNLESIKESIMEMDTKNKVILGVSAFAVVGVLGFGGYTLANNLGGADTNSNKVAVSTDKNETSLGVTSESEKEDAKKKEEAKKEDSKENKDSNKKEDTKETSKKEESKESDSKTEEKKESSSVESTTSSNTVSSTPSTNNQSSGSSSAQSSKPSTNSTSKPSTSGGNSSSSNTQQSKPQETPVVEEKPVVEQKPVEQKPVVEQKPSTPSWWGEGKSEAEIMKTVTDALVWKNEITGETYYGLNGLKFGWNLENNAYGGLVLVSNPYGVSFTGDFSGGAYAMCASTSIRYDYYNEDVVYQSSGYYVNISAPSEIPYDDILAFYGQ